MAETTITNAPKRSREETQNQEVEEMKRQKTSESSSSTCSPSYSQILSILETEGEEEEEELVEDISSLITSLQQEISTSDGLPTKESSTATTPLSDNDSNKDTFEDLSSSSSASSNEDEEDKERVIRHLLEASDDELGIPQMGLDFEFEDDEVRSNYGEVGLFNLGGYDSGLWEFEDETANYYTLLQSELFM
ncbi:hypothetical protein C5167_033042 [Papaver somniferum]|uniref:Uncharacterized protein n=1 Tax=Papaver somniferum TaxID=3469 RepID=A0A4Y7K962_PAPSO|nr:hypothetical protein C5167_033042 [Papaver somniferum]